MTALRLVMITTMLASLALVTPASAEWYVVQNQVGSRNVVDYAPGYGWTILFGPYASRDAAIRDIGTGDVFAQRDMPFTKRPPVPVGEERTVDILAAAPMEFNEIEVQMPAARVSRQARAGRSERGFEGAATAGREKSAMERPAGEAAEFEFFEVKGVQARDSAGKDLGRIDHLTVAKDGRISFVVFTRQGKFVPVPWEAVHFGGPREALIIDVDKDKLASAPAFDRKDFHQAMSRPDFHDRVASFFQGSTHKAEGAAMEKPAGKAMEMSKPGMAESKEKGAMHMRSGSASKEMPEKEKRTDVPVEAPHSAPMNQ